MPQGREPTIHHNLSNNGGLCGKTESERKKGWWWVSGKDVGWQGQTIFCLTPGKSTAAVL